MSSGVPLRLGVVSFLMVDLDVVIDDFGCIGSPLASEP